MKRDYIIPYPYKALELELFFSYIMYMITVKSLM